MPAVNVPALVKLPETVISLGLKKMLPSAISIILKSLAVNGLKSHAVNVVVPSALIASLVSTIVVALSFSIVILLKLCSLSVTPPASMDI